MDKDSKWYKSIQILFDVAKKFGDMPVKNDDDMGKIYFPVKEIANKENQFVSDLLMAFLKEKRRESSNEVR